MEEDYLKNCRFCLKYHKELSNLFLIELDFKNHVNLVDFVGKMTDLTITKGEFLPSGICSSCIDVTQIAYNFVQQCIISHNILKKHETQREFRKIEQEALLEEPEEEQIILIQQKQSKTEPENETIPKLDRTQLGFEMIDDHKQESKVIDSVIDYTSKNHTKLEENMSSTLKSVLDTSADIEIIDYSDKTKFSNYEEMHDITKPFRCNECPQTFFKQVHLAVHVRSHLKIKEKPLSCQFCGKNYTYEYLLKQHELKHTGEKPHPCPTCNKGCFSQNSLKRHMVIHSESYSKKIHNCDICHKTFAYPSYLAEHMKIHTGAKPHLCPTCGKGFKQVGQLHVHQRIHSGVKPFKCTICDDCFISKSKLKIHILKHTKEKPFVCEQCGLAFRQSYDLKMHIRTHSSEKPVQCTICSKRMATTGQLTVHLRTHTGERPYSCKVCNKAFAINTTLVKHLRIHSGERPYKCDVCFKDFNQASILKTHKKIHDSSTPNMANQKKLKRRNTNSKKKEGDIEMKEDVNSANIMFLSGGATVRLALPVPEIRQDLEREDLIVCPAPIPLLTK